MKLMNWYYDILVDCTDHILFTQTKIRFSIKISVWTKTLIFTYFASIECVQRFKWSQCKCEHASEFLHVRNVKNSIRNHADEDDDDNVRIVMANHEVPDRMKRMREK